MIVGIDEVGRGPWAGPLVFGAVVLGDAAIAGLTDSKKLSPKKRELLAVEIHKKAASIGIGWVAADELDTLGMRDALTLACRRALEQIVVSYDQIIIDGTVNFLKDTGKGPYVTTIKQADLLIPSVSAASIIAKVARDTYMIEQATIYPEYGFEKHVGYGTKQHKLALDMHGVTPLHRRSFAPISSYSLVEPSFEPHDQVARHLTTKRIGDRAEIAVTTYLESIGYEIVEQNWKTKACEIDIVAIKAGVIYFVEVKYRKRAEQGGGLAAITPRKLRQMERAARIWFMKHGEQNSRLSAIEVTGECFTVTQFVPQV